jgi:DNA-binding response OmpR family regulator
VSPSDVAFSEPAIASPALPSEDVEADDLVERLRLVLGLQPLGFNAKMVLALVCEAVAEIERLRRTEAAATEGSGIDWERQTIIRDGDRVSLTGREWLIFRLLVKNAGKLVTRSELLNELYWWDPSGGAEPKIIDVYVHKLRKKTPWPITTVWGRGFIIDGCTHEKRPIPLPRMIPGLTRERLMAGR